VTLPGVKAALPGISGNVRFLVQTDQPEKIRNALGNLAADIRIKKPVIERDPYHSLGAAHREALELAAEGECIAFINADMVPSIECFAAAEHQFNHGKRLIMMAATSTVADDIPPIGVSASELLVWTMQHRHPSVIERFWDEGHCACPFTIYFRRGEDIVMRAFHLHPFSLIKDRSIDFGTTIDNELVSSYARDEIHIVTGSGEAAFAEVSPRVPGWGNLPLMADKMSVGSVAKWASDKDENFPTRRHTNPMHRWMFEHQIAICGNRVDIGDHEICTQILAAARNDDFQQC
jgi:hypothetical protein